MISRSQMGKQLTGDRMPIKKDSIKKMAGGGFMSSGNDLSDLEIIRSVRNIDDGTGGRNTTAMKKGGKVKKSRVNEAGNYTKPTMRKRLFNEIKAGGKGGKPGQWSARKAQMLAKRYKDSGGGYTS
jgi:hypothetical protein